MDKYLRDFKDLTHNTYEIKNDHNFRSTMNQLLETKTFSLFHNNIRSLNKHYDQLTAFLSELDNDFSCIALTETWNSEENTFFNLENYQAIHCNSKVNQNDGITVYIKNNLQFFYENVKIGISNALKIILNQGNQTFCLLVIYRPPSTNEAEFVTHLNGVLDEIDLTSHEHVFIIGDINLDILREEGNTNDTEEYLNILSEKGFHSLINKPTRVSNTSTSCIDHIFLKSKNFDENSTYAAVIHTNITDHYSTMVVVKNVPEINTKLDCDCEFLKINYPKLKEILSNENWNDIYCLRDVDECVDMFISRVKEAITRSSKKMKIPKRKKKKPWITYGIINSIKTRDKLFLKLKQNPNNAGLKNEYNTYRNKVNALLKKAKHDYFTNEIERKKNDSSNLWKVIKNFAGIKKTTNNHIEKIVTENGNELTSCENIAEEFNKYFSEAGEKLAAKLPSCKTEFQDEPLSNSIFLSPTDCDEVKQIILELKDNKSPGLDGISNEILKYSVSALTEPISFIINKCIEQGKVPSHFKNAKIIPIYKKGEKTDMSNYRPISLISSVSKIFEKIVKHRVMKYLNKYKIISKFQYGFQEKLSTQDAVAELTSNIYQALDDRKSCLGVFIDLAKAFDSVCHQLLLEKLEHIGMRGNTIKLFKSYLENRKQYVDINGCLSSEKTVISGVPQGTVLGPILFLIYLNDLLKLDTTGTLISFADDTVVLFTANSWDEVKQKAEKGMKLINKWFNENRVTMNVQKTKIIPFTSYEKYLPTYNTIIINSTDVEYSKSVKYLGIYIDSFLRWNIHVDHLKQKLRTLIYKFYQFRNILKLNSLKLLYFALVESHLRYCIIGWGGVNKNLTQQLGRVQKRILKIIYKKSINFPSQLLFSELKVLDIRQLFAKSTLLHLQKHKFQVQKVEHKKNTRSQNLDNLFRPRSRKAIGQKTFTYIGPRIYNLLPENVKDLRNIHSFKRQIVSWILSLNTDILYNIIESNTT